ncbi:hypothetical protein GCM10028857_14070 [Salinarchaeum chitinilyticum]
MNETHGRTAGDGPDGDGAGDDTSADRPNVVLLVMDTARARDVLGRPDVTPNLHRIAEAGEVFSNVFTSAPWTLPSHASMFTGQYTSDHGTHAGSKVFDPDVPPIAEALRERGYQTAAFSNNSWVSSDVGFDRGFETFRSGWELFESDVDLVRVAKQRDGALEQLRGLRGELSVRELPPTLANVLHAKLFRHRYDDGAWLTNRRIGRWLDRARDPDRPFFAFVNYLEPHLEYRPPRGHRSTFLPADADYEEASAVNQDAWAYLAGTESMDERDFELLHALYRSELNYLDRRIGELYDGLADRGLLEDTVVFVVGDHGENLGDHGLMDHQYSLHDTLTHVPLVCHSPDGVSFPATGDGLRELRDLYPTILDLAGVGRKSGDRRGGDRSGASPNDGDRGGTGSSGAGPSGGTGSSGDGRTRGDRTGGDRLAADSISQRSLLDPRGREYVVGEYVHPQPDVETLAERVGDVTVDLERFDRGLRCIRTPEWKFVEGTDGSERLYSVPRPEAAIESDVTDETLVAEGGLASTAELVPRQDGSSLRERIVQLRDRLHDEHGEMARPRRDVGEKSGTDEDVGAATQQRLEDLGYI